MTKLNYIIAPIIMAVFIYSGYLYLRLDTVIAQRDKLKNEAMTLQKTLAASQQARNAENAALEKTKEEDNDRNQFEKQAILEIQKNRLDHDGPLAPVAIDVIERVRDRWHNHSRSTPDSR